MFEERQIDHPRSKWRNPKLGVYLNYWRFLIMLWTILLILLLVMLFGALPTWPYSTDWGFYPSSGLALLLIVMIVVMFAGRRRRIREKADNRPFPV